jgi:hypothetical protein
MVRSAPAVRVTERVAERVAEHPAENEPRWASLQAGAEPILDASGEPVLHVRSSGQITPVGIARTNITNIMSDPEGVEFATDLVKARLSEELKPAAARKTARSDVESDFVILRRSRPMTRFSTSSDNPLLIRCADHVRSLQPLFRLKPVLKRARLLTRRQLAQNQWRP